MRAWAEFGIIYKFSIFSIKKFGYFAILTFPTISDIIITEREENKMILIFAIPLLSLLFLSAFVLDEWEEKKRKAKEEAERQKRKNILKKTIDKKINL